jgi:type IV secretion system protein VirD4
MRFEQLTGWKRLIFFGAGGLVFGAIVGTLVANLYVGFASGSDILHADLTRLLAPWFLPPGRAALVLRPAAFHVALGLTLLPPLFAAVLAMGWTRRVPLSELDNSHWQTPAEIRAGGYLASLDRYPATSLLFGELGKSFVAPRSAEFPHAIMVAPTGSGKGVGVVLPNLFMFGGSAIVLDVKGENHAITSAWRKKRLKQAVWYFAPYDEQHGTHAFNPLAKIAAIENPSHRYNAIEAMIDVFLTVDDPRIEGFLRQGKTLLIAACLYAIEQGTPTLGDAHDLLFVGDKPTAYAEYAVNAKDERVKKIFANFATQHGGILDSNLNVIGGAGLSAWNTPAIRDATDRSDFDFATFRTRPQTLYISIPALQLKTVAPLVRLLVGAALSEFQSHEPRSDDPHQVLFLLDEFDQLGRMPVIIEALKTARSYGVRFLIITQTIPGLQTVYRQDEVKSFLGASAMQVFMTPADDETAQVISQALGNRTTVSVTESRATFMRAHDSTHESRTAQERPLISAQELRRFPKNEVILMPRGGYPIRARHIVWYRHRYFGQIAEALPQHPPIYPSLGTVAKMPTSTLRAKARAVEAMRADLTRADAIRQNGQKKTGPRTPPARRAEGA